MSSSLGTFDYVLIVATQLTCVAIGLYFVRKERNCQTVQNFAVANRSMSAFAAGVSLMATYVNALAMVGHVSEMVAHGLVYGTWNVCLGFGTLFAAYAVVPVFHRSPYISIYQIVERKFGTVFLQLFISLYCLLQLLFSGIILYVPAVVLSEVSNIQSWIATVSLGFVCIGYSTVGGIKAVIWTDVFQAILMLTSMFSITISGVLEAGGLGKISDLMANTDFFHFSFIGGTKKHSFLPIFTNGLIGGLIHGGCFQHILQRTISVKNEREAKRASWIAFSLLLIFNVCLLTSATAICLYFYSHGDAISTNQLTNDQVIPVFIRQVLTKTRGLAGFVVAGILCGSLSTLSSSLNSCAVLISNDFFQRYVDPNYYKKKSVFFCKVMTITFGLLSIAIAMVIPSIGGVVPFFLRVSGVLSGPVGAGFLLIVFRRKLSMRAVLLSFGIAVSFVSWLAIGNTYADVTTNLQSRKSNQNFTRSSYDELWGNHTGIIANDTDNAHTNEVFILYKISPTWYVILCFTICVTFSVLFTMKIKNLISSPIDILSPWILTREEKKAITRNSTNEKVENTDLELLN